MKTNIGTFGGYCALVFTIAFLASSQTAFGDAYTLDTCPVSGGKLGSMGGVVVKEYNGREVRFCCAGCPGKFEAKQVEFTKKIDAALIKQQTPLYPLETCLVSGEKLGSMGPAIDYAYQNRLIRFCCKGCIGKFEKDPAKYLSKLNAAVVKRQKASYALKTCVVSGEKFGGDMGEPIEYVVGNRLIRLCCKGCVKKFEKDPLQFLSKLNGASHAKGAGSDHKTRR